MDASAFNVLPSGLRWVLLEDSERAVERNAGLRSQNDEDVMTAMKPVDRIVISPRTRSNAQPNDTSRVARM